MRHAVARRLLAGLLDELPPAETREVRGHLVVCRRCRRRLHELEASQDLLRRIPAAFVPLDGGAAGRERLRALARWAPAPRPRWTRPLPALGSCAAAALAILAMASLGPAPAAGVSAESPRRLVLASRSPSAFLAPALGRAATGFPHTLGR